MFRNALGKTYYYHPQQGTRDGHMSDLLVTVPIVCNIDVHMEDFTAVVKAFCKGARAMRLAFCVTYSLLNNQVPHDRPMTSAYLAFHNHRHLGRL
uniref:Uncharacterized protein n=1 Tax=Anguilla anguilla TaxID=7936 RepID=A0A0E9QZ77_ANGAN